MNTNQILPPTMEAWLPSVGLNERRATRHVFSHRARETRGDGDGYTIYFRCTETGSLRRWGRES